MSNQNQVELGRGPVLHEVEYWRLMKAAWAAARLGANEAVLMVSSSGARLFAADDLMSPGWWVDTAIRWPSAAAGRALLHTPVPGGVGRITSVLALLSLSELSAIPPGPVASWSLLEAVARLLSPLDPAGGAAAAAVTGSLAAALDGLCRMHQPPEEIASSGEAAVRLLLAADRDRLAFGAFQRAQRRAQPDLAALRAEALDTPREIAEQLEQLETRLRGLRTTQALELDRRLAQEIVEAAKEAVLRLQQEFSAQA